MATERQIPGGAYVNEVETAQRQIPGDLFLNEVGPPPPVGTLGQFDPELRIAAWF